MAKAITEPLGGMRDYLPLDVLRRGYVIETIERVYQSYGFEPLETPAMERLSTLLGKYGEEGDQLIFRVLKRGNQLQNVLQDSPTEDELADEGLRYDLTVPLARVMAEYRHQLPGIFKRYQIQPVWRADRPAKGRFREFFQCDVDVVGSTSPLVEAEVISAAAQVLHELGFVGDDAFSVRLNHRAILRAFMEVAGVPHRLEGEAIVAVDKLDKISVEAVQQELIDRGVPEKAADRLLQLFDEAQAGNEARLDWMEDVLEGNEAGSRAVTDLRALLCYVQHTPSAPHVCLDPYLARGLSYYTGTIFEIVAPGVRGSLGGGGRYDELLGMFSGQNIPACGFSLGLERIIVLMTEREMFPDRLTGQAQVLVTQKDQQTAGACFELAHELRQAGLRTDLYVDFKGYGAQFKYADKRHIRYALLLSEREIEADVVAVKDLISGDQIDVPRGEIAEWLVEKLG
jgi:histidyl-tRNA synthetase